MVRIRFRETGGIAGLDREIAFDGRQLSVSDHGVVNDVLVGVGFGRGQRGGDLVQVAAKIMDDVVGHVGSKTGFGNIFVPDDAFEFSDRVVVAQM